MHERGRLLAAEAVDSKLAAADAAWLKDHLAGCAECRTAAAEIGANRDELRLLKMPEPPRDLWARTSAAFDAVDRSAARGPLGLFSTERASRQPLFGTAIAVGLVVLFAGVSLFTQPPIDRGSGSPGTSDIAIAPTPMPLAPLGVMEGTGYWAVKSDDKTTQIKSGSAECTEQKCAVTEQTDTTLGSITSDVPVSAVLAPGAGQAAVWTDSKIVVLPLVRGSQTTVSMDLLTPRPTVLPTESIVPPTEDTSGAPETAEPTATPVPTPFATPEIVSRPTAILDGYEIVGRDPEFSPDGAWMAFSARPADHSSGPDLFLWRSGGERAQAVTSSHAALFSGWRGRQILVTVLATVPPIPVESPSAAAETPTTEPTSEPAAPDAEAALRDSTTPPVAISYLFDPESETAQRIERTMALPVADPAGVYLVYWSGALHLDTASGMWEPGLGDLYFDSWANLKLAPASLDDPAPVKSGGDAEATLTPGADASGTAVAGSPDASLSPTPTPTPTPTPVASPLPQRLPVSAVQHAVRDWVVRWDASGRHVAAWVADSADGTVGRLSLFAIDRTAGLVNVEEPLFAAPALSAIQFDEQHLLYTSPTDGQTYLVSVPQVAPSASPTSPAPTPSPGVDETPGSGASPEPLPTGGPGD
jgi:hypothetical protein